MGVLEELLRELCKKYVDGNLEDVMVISGGCSGESIKNAVSIDAFIQTAFNMCFTVVAIKRVDKLRYTSINVYQLDTIKANKKSLILTYKNGNVVKIKF